MTAYRSRVAVPVVAAALLMLAGGLGIAVEPAASPPIVFEHDLEVYALDAAGGRLTKLLPRATTEASSGHCGELMDAYFQPSLSPDGRRLAVIRAHNYSRVCFGDRRLRPRQSDDIVIVDVAGRSEAVVDSRPSYALDVRGPDQALRALASPVWSRDGRLFYLLGSSLMRYSEGEGSHEIARLPFGSGGHPTPDWLTTVYLRPSPDGAALYVLAAEFGRACHGVVWLVALDVGRSRQLFSGPLARLCGKVDPPVSGLDDMAVENLFGSRRRPVLAPRFSADRRTYYFVDVRFGWFASKRVVAVSVADGRETTLRTLNRGLYWE